MGDIKQKIVLEQVTDVSSTLEGIKKVQEALKKLTLPPEIQDGFDKIFQKAEKQAEKANAALSSGFKNKGDVKKYSDAMDQIVGSYDELIRKINTLNRNKKVNLSIDDSSLKTVLDELKTLNEQWKKINGELSSVQKKSGQAMEKAAGNHKGGAAAWNDAVKAFKDGDIEGAEKALKKLNTEVQKAETRAQKNGTKLSDDWVQYKEDVETMTNALNNFKNAESNEAIARDNLNKKQQEADAIYARGSNELNNMSSALQAAGQNAGNFARQTTEAAKESQQLNSELEHFKSKAAYFFGIANGINLLKRAIRSAYNTVKDLDAVMTETAVVTDFDVGDMWAQLPEYTQRANELGVSIHSAYEAATIFYQQGLKTNEVMAVSNETLKMARIAGLDAATASDRMTNALRGFNMEMDKMSAQRVNDVYSKLAAITASNTDEISTAMTKVASLAHNANMEFETTAAFLAQIIESTRESAETAGTALKTVVARFSEVKKLYSKGELLGTDEEGEEIDVNRVATALRSAGINLNEYLTGAKGLDDIFMELAEKWDSLDIVQQRYIATMAAGSRQQSRFIALMSDYKRTMELVDAANNANGASQEQYNKTLESLETKLSRLKNAWNEFVLGLANSDAIKGAVDLLTNLITAINKLISAISGKNSGVKMITSFFTAFTAFKIGQKAIGKSGALTGFFDKLVGGSEVMASHSAAKIANGFYNELANNIIKFDAEGGIPGKIKQAGTNFFGSFANFFDPNAILRSNLDKSLATPESWNSLQGVLGKNGLTLDELNAALKASNQNLEITTENAAEFGITLDENNNIINNNTAGIKTFSAATVVAGGALIAFGNYLEKMEGPAKYWGFVIKGLGAGLLTFGTIMSVYLPLQAQLMAKGITGAIVSIPIIGWVAAIISALVALGTVIYKFAKDNSLEERLKKVSTDLKNATEAANDTKEAYEKLGEAWDDLSDKYDVIENATKGTQEWKDAVREVNDAVLDLANTYENIKIERDEDGILHITNQEQIDEQERSKVSAADAAARVTKVRSLELEQEKLYKELRDKLSDDIIAEELGRGGDLKGIGDKTIDEIKEIGKKYEYNISDSDARALQEYGRKYRNNQELINSQKEGMGATVVSNAGVPKNLQGYANTLVSDQYLDALVEKYRTEIGDTYSEKDIKNKYAEKQGYSNYADFAANNSNAKDISTEQMKDYLVAANALEEASKQLTTFTNNISGLTDTQKALFEGRNGSNLTQEQLDYLKNNTNVEDFYKKLGGDEVYGEGGLKAFTDWFNEALSSASANFNLENFSEKFVGTLDADLTKNLSSGTYKNFVDNLWSVYSTSGTEGVQKVQKSISQMSKKVDSKKMDSFIKSISSVNWASADSIKTLDDLAKEYGLSEDAIRSLEEQLINFNNAARQIDLEKMASLFGIAKKIGNGAQGRNFSEEDYKLLTENGVDKDKFVYNIETGKYDYIGQNVQEVRDAILDQTDVIEGLNKEIASGEAVQAAIKQVGTPDETNPESLKKFLGSYIYFAKENSVISREALQGNAYQLKEAYDRVMATLDKQPDNIEKANQIEQQKYQLNSGMVNAGLANAGDENAKNVLLSQLQNSGLTEDVIKEYTNYINAGLGHKTEQAGSLVNTVEQAKAFGIDIEKLNSYVEALRQIEGLEKANADALYALALANERYQDGFKNVIESYDDWIQLKKEDGSIAPPEDGNLEQLQTYEKLKKDLKEMFNLSEDISDSFLKSSENVDLMEKAVKGDTKAVSQLRANLAKSELGININAENKDKIEKAIDDLAAQTPNLEFGVSLNDSEYAQQLMNLMLEAGATAEQINKAFSDIGFTPPITGYEEVPYETLQQNVSKGDVQVVDPVTGAIKTVTVNNVTDYENAGTIKVPIFGDSKFVKPSMPSTKPKSKSKGGGGGSKKKATYWENPYDELYNLQQKINEALRTREALERRYQKLLKQEQATLADIRKSYYAQITNLRGEADLQKQFAAGRLRQIKELGNKIYTDDEGNRKTFSSLGVTKYASYNSETGLITIDWEGLDAISKNSNRVKEGKAAEAYISKLEELVSSYEEVRDKLWDIEDKIENLREAAIESYVSFEGRVMEALVNRYQQQIDSYQSMSDAIDKANTEVIDSLRKQIDLSRQIRDNTEKEKEISDMENRLAYLQRDTSGANALEVQKLQKDLDERREGYVDTLVDQAIGKMQNDADLAAEQRARQIETMQEQLEIMKNTGALWQEVYDLIGEAAAGDGALSPHSNLVELLKGTEAFASLSNIGQAKWWGQVAEEFHAAWVGKGEAEDKYKVDADNDGTIYNSGTSNAVTEVTTAPVTTPATTTPVTTTTSQPKYTDKEKYGVALAVCDGYWGNGADRKRNLESKGFNYNEIQGIVNKVYKDAMSGSWYGKYYGIKDISQYKMSKFKQGGLADFTGPAWLDGTKTKPEIILNAKDSANFIALKDILASLLNNSGANGELGGTKQVNVDINANISSDYDVDRLVDRVKKDIYGDGTYRNNNSIGFLR